MVQLNFDLCDELLEEEMLNPLFQCLLTFFSIPTMTDTRDIQVSTIIILAKNR